MSNVLVTGADGFIGSHLVERLVRDGANVRAFLYYNSFNSWGWLDHCAEDVSGQFEPFVADIRDPDAVREAVRGIDTVYHLASLIAIPYSYRAPHSYIETNINGTLNVLQAARDAGVSKLVHTSTSEVYGTAQFVPITEEHPLQGQSPYSASKIGADQMALSFHASFDCPVTVARPFNTYGPRQSARAIIPTIISQISNGRRKLELGDLRPTREFNLVHDTVAGFLAIGAAEASVGEVINIGNGFEISIGDLVQQIADVMEVEVTIESKAERIRPEKSEVFRLCSSFDKATRLTGWTPQYGGIEGLRTGLRETAAWFQQPENLSRYKADIYNQ